MAFEVLKLVLQQGPFETEAERSKMATIDSQFITISQNLNHVLRRLTDNAQHEYDRIEHMQVQRQIQLIQDNVVDTLSDLHLLRVFYFRTLPSESAHQTYVAFSQTCIHLVTGQHWTLDDWDNSTPAVLIESDEMLHLLTRYYSYISVLQPKRESNLAVNTQSEQLMLGLAETYMFYRANNMARKLHILFNQLQIQPHFPKSPSATSCVRKFHCRCLRGPWYYSVDPSLRYLLGPWASYIPTLSVLYEPLCDLPGCNRKSISKLELQCRLPAWLVRCLYSGFSDLRSSLVYSIDLKRKVELSGIESWIGNPDTLNQVLNEGFIYLPDDRLDTGACLLEVHIQSIENICDFDS
jgi:hypothetical protein